MNTDTARLSLTIDTPPTIRLSGSLPFVYAAADEDHPDAFTVRLYHCPTDPAEELRLTWDALRRQHAGFCKACRKLWPLPRRVLSPDQLRAIADKRQLEIADLT